MARFVRSHSSPLILGGLLAVMLGALFGLGLFTVAYARGTSYLQDDPQACVNCHIMREQFTAWNQSSHRAVATCNDCHTLHDPVGKWVSKGINGFNHSLAFTTGNFLDPIRIKPFNADIVQASCIGCHQTAVSQVYGWHDDQSRRCVDCHGNVGHDT